MRTTVAEIAVRIGGSVVGDGSAEITGLAGLSDARAGDITFLSNPRYSSKVATTAAAAVIVGENWTGQCPCAIIKVKNADKAFMQVAMMIGPKPPEVKPGIHPTAIVAQGVKLGKDVGIGPYCILEPGVKVGDRSVLIAACYLGQDTVIGADCRLYPHVTTREGTIIGNRVIIHNGAVIGSDGFGYVRDGVEWKKIPQIGHVEVGDDVEIGANTTIDRARFGKTVIGRGVKLDNLVQVAHNVRIGDHSAIAAQSGVAGSAVLGSNVQIGGQSGVVGHVTVGDNVILGAKSGIIKDTPGNLFVMGFPAEPHDKAKKMLASLARLPELRKTVLELEKRLSELEEKKGDRQR